MKSTNDFQPRFLIDEITVNFTGKLIFPEKMKGLIYKKKLNSYHIITIAEHREPGSEYWQLIDTVDREELNDLEKAPPVCYYVISGNDENRFIVEPLNHRISVRKFYEIPQINSILLLKLYFFKTF